LHVQLAQVLEQLHVLVVLMIFI
jgi:hypothetical protein